MLNEYRGYKRISLEEEEEEERNYGNNDPIWGLRRKYNENCNLDDFDVRAPGVKSKLLLRHNGPLERFVGIESAEKDVSASLLTLIEKPLTLALMQLLFLLPLLFLNPSVSNFMILTFTLTVDT
ncbi:hypothetical protein GQX74_015198 [Glossina fuscipes]|nr:hypothetical protein GQX74_015198 [Glossina fuscipes]